MHHVVPAKSCFSENALFKCIITSFPGPRAHFPNALSKMKKNARQVILGSGVELRHHALSKIIAPACPIAPKQDGLPPRANNNG